MVDGHQSLQEDGSAFDKSLIKTKNIKEYYDGVNIFMTGATGFLGKVLTEKLLRSCSGVKKIYILLRSKRGVDCERRFQEFVKNQVFDNIRKEDPSFYTKIVYLTGDISEPNVGLNENDTKLLKENVNIVFHVAATVRFNEALELAASLNTFGTQRVMELCSGMKALKVNFLVK